MNKVLTESVQGIIGGLTCSVKLVVREVRSGVTPVTRLKSVNTGLLCIPLK